LHDAFRVFVEWYSAYGYPILFLGVLLENIGLPVPGEAALLVAGFMASPEGGSHFHLGWVIPIAFAAAVLGDNGGYWLGRRFARPRIQSGRRFLLLTPQTFENVERYFQRYGLWTVFLARFFAGLRVVAALAAGTAGMPWGPFVLSNAAGALTWAVTMGLLGYFFGENWKLLEHGLGWGSWIILGCVLVVVGLRHFWMR
jgi:membrane protein DedA with SNARE-associated domain